MSYQSQGQSLQLPPSLRFHPLREGNQTDSVPPACRGNLKEGVIGHTHFCELWLGDWYNMPAMARTRLRAGAAKVDITPDLTKIRIQLGGYNARLNMPPTGVHDPIYARALALEVGEQSAVMVALITCWFRTASRARCCRRRDCRLRSCL